MLGKASVLVVAEVDIRGLQFTEQEDRQVAEIEFLLVVAHRESGEFFRYDQSDHDEAAARPPASG